MPDDHECRVTELPSIAPPAGPDPAVVRWCKELLAQAEAGEVHAAAVVCQSSGGAITTSFELGAEGRIVTLLGAVTLLEADLIDATRDIEE